jgi:hypothetical protein
MRLKMSKNLLQNNIKKKCESCGDPEVCTKYNNSYVCIQCFRMDKRGIPRDNQGRIISSTETTVLLTTFEKSWRKK